MKEDQMITRRRALLAGAVALGAAGAAGLLAPDTVEEPAGPVAGAAGAPARRPASKPSVYRLEPLTGYG
ncbi:polysaccharide deacetylase family protein, partial [Streptomyces sp. NPDC059378]